MMTGKAGILHLHLGDGARGLDLVRQALETAEIPARTYNPAHCNRRKALFEEACELAEKGCSIDVGAFPVEEGEDALWAHEAILRYREEGIDSGLITVSSDSGGCLPTFNDKGEIVRMEVGTCKLLHHTLAELLKSGLKLEEALPPFAANAASLLRLPHKGRIAAGCDADLIQLGDDNGIRSVMARGAWHMRDGKILRRGTFEG
jgi:beta-aspartyl-dipeptidase (metallo-type)